jgi:hypothetical protein
MAGCILKSFLAVVVSFVEDDVAFKASWVERKTRA